MKAVIWCARVGLLFFLASCSAAPGIPDQENSQPTVEEAQTFIGQVEKELLQLWHQVGQAEWVRMTYITPDTEALASRANEQMMEYVSRQAAEATRFDRLQLSEELKRKFHMLKTGLDMPAPGQAAARAELAKIATGMGSRYGKGQYCSEKQKGRCFNLGELTDILAKSRDYDELLDVWQGWRKISVPMRPNFQRFVELVNLGAQDLGFVNLADLWNNRYDMTPAAFEAEVERLWLQVEPLYRDLHCHIRAKLTEVYGAERVPAEAPIPAHLLGNMWSQEWTNLFDLVAPEPNSAKTFDVEAALLAKGYDQLKMVKQAESFFTSLGMDSLPETFWQRSMFEKPRDREVVCHASAWDVDNKEDLRIKMCIKVNGEDFTTIHHELGHNYYQYAYRDKGALFLNSANDGFHEALGDLISLSVTPAYMKEIGLIDKLPPDNLNPLMLRALEKVAFLPWGMLVDRWRWRVFRGEIKPEQYNQSWWELRHRYQGIVAPVSRSEADFDPGAKYHIPANVPYTRYFLAAILQFQFHRALCKAANHSGPLHTCSIYGNQEVGARIQKMMEMGASRPWPEAMQELIGEKQMDATAILEYFRPLHEWLQQQNQSRICGW